MAGYLAAYSARLKDRLPPEMVTAERWCCWRWGRRSGQKQTKIPVHWRTGANLDATKTTNGEALETVLTSPLAEGKVNGVGFILGDGWCGIDLDNAVEDNDPKSWARDVLDRFPETYAEYSVSGTGVHIIVKGTKPEGRCRRALGDGEIELYGGGRYFCVSGLPLPESSQEVQTDTKAIATLVADLFAGEGPKPAGDGSGSVIGSIGVFPLAKHEALLTNLSVYKRTWEHNRKDLHDNSLSGYDMALASAWASADWTDEEIVAGIREHRTKYSPGDTKWQRKTYVADTVARARSRATTTDAERKATQVIEQPGDASRTEKLKALATALHIPLTNIIRITGQTPRLRFILGGHAIEMPMEQVMRQGTFRSKLFALTTIPPRMIGPKEKPGWDHYLAVMAAIAEVVEGGDETTLDGEMRTLLRAFVESRVLEEIPPGTMIVHAGDPFLRDGRLWFRAQDLAQHAAVVGGFRNMDRPQLLQRLRAMGAVRKTMSTAKRGNKEETTTAGFYGLPADQILGEEPVE